MDFEAALTMELKTIAAFGSRVYPLTAPEATAKNGVPYLIYRSSDGLRTKTLDGYQSGKAVEGEINVIAARYADMKSLTSKVIDLLVGMEQRAIGNDGPFIQELTYRQPIELYEEQPDLYRCLIDFEVYFDQGG
ncbi:tail completion protein gp17 [Paenibacillus ginsengarvi]|uniref:DUF3168 domain-containing protein n=1 Tax=Paenibacillus ginsengarvi TaxID=400777 RepID=A0A3B0CTI7_9BACL|nr:DUF3168 domain-containing protein [Paenibacillus ginsengarvi]RKN86744.1 DUF3168 domain-containing protein [Paenibacillus ginsengarvi]